jgi:hypothetical protein
MTIGEWGALNEFNSAEKHRRLGSIFGLSTRSARTINLQWSESFFCCTCSIIQLQLAGVDAVKRRN